MPHEIILSQGPDSWLATFTDPAILEAFGTDTVPCAFTNRAPALWRGGALWRGVARSERRFRASYGGTKCSRMRDDAVVRTPCVHRLSFRATGTPASGSVRAGPRAPQVRDLLRRLGRRRQRAGTAEALRVHRAVALVAAEGAVDGVDLEVRRALAIDAEEIGRAHV